MISKLVGLASISGTVSSVALLRRFLGDIATVVALTVLSSLAVGVLVLFGFYWLYVGLVYAGLMPSEAVLSLTGTTLVLTVLLIGWTRIQIQRLRTLPTRPLHNEIPGVAKITGIANAFWEGLTEKGMQN
jgi:hypothetical protein